MDGNKHRNEISDKEITEELVMNMHKKKKIYFVFLGGILGCTVLIALAFILPNYQKSEAIKKNLNLGENYLEEGSYDTAKLMFEKVLEIDPKQEKANVEIAKIEIEAEDYHGAEKALLNAKESKDSGEVNVLLYDVYINTNRLSKAQETAKVFADKKFSEITTQIKAGEILKSVVGMEEAEIFYKNWIRESKNSPDLEMLYKELLTTQMLLSRDESTINTTINEGRKKLGNSDFGIQNIAETDLEPLNEYFKTTFDFFLSGFPKDFSEISELDKEWISLRYYKDLTAGYSVLGEGFFDKLKEKGYVGYTFVFLADIEKIARENINPEIKMPATGDYSSFRILKWVPDEKGFVSTGKGYGYYGYLFLIDNAQKLDNRIFVTGSEIVESDFRYDIPSDGETGTLKCDETIVGATVAKGTRGKNSTTAGFERTYTIPQDQMQKWRYVLEEKPEGGFILIAKAKIK